MRFSELLKAALNKANKQETLATELDLSPSALSKRINGEVGWTEREIDHLLDYVECEITCKAEAAHKIYILEEALRIFMEKK